MAKQSMARKQEDNSFLISFIPQNEGADKHDWGRARGVVY